MDEFLYRACCTGNKEVVQRFASFNNVKYTDPTNGDTLLHQACKQGWLDIVKLLIEEYGCDPNVTNKYAHQSPLHYACQYGHKKVVEYLINELDVNPRDGRDPTHGDTLLHQACKQGWLDIVKLLIEKYACDPNVTNLLHDACQYGNIDIVEYLINQQHVNPLLRDKFGLEPLDHALNNNKTDIAIYICQHCITSVDLLNPNRIKTTINLIISILRANNWKWKTTDGDNILHIVESSKSCISYMPSAVVLKILNSGAANYNIIPFQPDWKTGNGDKFLELVCQSKTYLSHISSALILRSIEHVTIDLVKISIPDSKTADGKTLIQFVCQSEVYLAHISTAVLSKWLSDTTLDLEMIINTPEWKTADGSTLLQLICQSKTCLSRVPSTLLLKWLSNTALYLPNIITVPNLETADGDTLLKLVCQSEMCLSRIPSAVLLMWLIINNVPFDDEFKQLILSDRKTANGDTVLQLVCQSEACLSRISSMVILKWLTVTILDTRTPTLDSKTTDDKSLLLRVCRSETCVSLISSAVMSKWLSDTTLNLINTIGIIVPHWKTADGDTLLKLICQSEKCLSLVPSVLLLKWVSTNTTHDLTKTCLHNSKTADSDTLLQLVCQSKLWLSQTSSTQLIKWLSDSTLDHVKISIPDFKTADDKPLLQLVCQLETTVSHISSAVLSKWLRDTSLGIKLEKIIIPEWKTADGDTLLQLVCESETCLSQISSAVLLKWLCSATLHRVNISLPNYKTADGDTLLQLVCMSETSVSRISSAILSKWLNTTLDINLAKIIIPEWKTVEGVTLLQLVCQSETCLSQISSAVLLKWLCITTLYYIDISLPDSKTADGDTLLQLVSKSETSVSLISSVVLSKWLRDTSLDVNLKEIIIPEWKTADGDTLLQLVCQSKTCLSRISSAVLLKWLQITTLHRVNISLPDSKTANGDTLLQLVCQSEIAVSQISSEVLSRWLRDTTLNVNFANIIIPEWKTADGDTLLQLVCQSKTCLSRISSAMLLKWLRSTTLHRVNISLPDSKTADGDTLLQLAYQSETTLSQISSAVLSEWLKNTTFDVNLANIFVSHGEWKTANGDTLLQFTLQSAMFISQISSSVLSKWLSDSREISIDIMKMVNPNWKTLDGDHFFHVLCQSKIEDKKLVKLMQYYMQEDGLNMKSLDSNGNTALHIACQTDKLGLVSLLLNEAQCDPSIENKMGNLPLDLTTNPEIINYFCQHDRVEVSSKTVVEWINNIGSIDDTAMLNILKALVDNHRLTTKDGSTLLHIICSTENIFCDKIRLIHYLLTEGLCDPNCLNSKGQMPLQLTSELRIMKKLVRHGAKLTTDIVFKVISSNHITEAKASELLTLSTKKRTVLWNPNDLNSDGYTALNLACKLNKPAIVNYLLTEAKCDPNANKSPLELTTNFGIVKMLIKHGARVTPELVLRFESREAIPNKHKLIELMLTTWNPDDRDSNGYTALHLACKAGSPTTINLLLTVAHCDPNIKSNNEEVPLQMTTNSDIIKDLIRHGAKTSIMYESKTCQNTLGTNEPIKPPVKVFIVGNPSVGKSSLTAALKKKLNIVARFFTSGKVSGVDQKTVGIVPHEVESDIYGRVTLYDFAGHREFYSGHAALLQTAIQSTPPVFLLVVNLYHEDDATTKDIMYWISFLENQCTSVNCKPHIILVGSHADSLKSSGINAKDKIKAIVDSIDAKCFMNMELVGFVAMDCQYHQSSGMSDLRSLLIKSCNELRIHEPITFNAHCFLVYLIDTFTNSPAVTINTIYNNIENQLMSQTKGSILEFLPQNFEALYKICLELNDRGHILLLKDRVAVENSYIVIDKEFLLSKISGTVFAPEGFKQYKQLSTNTGVVSLSKIAECFLDKDLDILIGFLTHLEFCHEISDQVLHQLISEQYSQVSSDRYYLFPGLISIKADDTVWKSQSNYDYNFGWILKCSCLEQFFSSRFLQVLLLRLAFSFALQTSCDDPNQSIGIHRNCYLWKNGIFWGSGFRMQTLVEVTPDNKSVILLARFQKVKLLQCVELRSKVIDTILQCKKQFCPRVVTTESFVDSSSSLQYPINPLANELTICTLQDLATAIVNESSVVLQCDEIDAENFLSFEPYLEMKLSTIHELWDEKNEKKVISERFLSTFAEQVSEKLTLIIGILIGNSASSTRDDQLYQNLLKWRDGDMNNQKTYCDLRQIVDQYSVFAGRNVLVSTDWSIMYAIA